MSVVLEGFLNELEKAQKLLSSYEQQMSYLKKEVEALDRKRVKLVDENKQLDIQLEDKKKDFEKSKNAFIKSAEDRNSELGKRELDFKGKESDLLKRNQKLDEKEQSLKAKDIELKKSIEDEKDRVAPKSESFKKILEKLSK